MPTSGFLTSGLVTSAASADPPPKALKPKKAKMAGTPPLLANLVSILFPEGLCAKVFITFICSSVNCNFSLGSFAKSKVVSASATLFIKSSKDSRVPYGTFLGLISRLSGVSVIYFLKAAFFPLKVSAFANSF